MSLPTLGLIIVVTLEEELPEDTLELKGHPAFAMPARFGLVATIDLVGRLLQQVAD
jgi:hypothetical protein